MHKPRIALVMVGCTAALVVILLRGPSETPQEARIVTVQRSDVHRVVAITGVLSYADETYAYADSNGIVARICTDKGQRVSKGDALVRVEAVSRQDTVAAAVMEVLQEEGISSHVTSQLAASDTVIRAQQDGTVRQILIEENMPVTLGMPVARLTSSRQEIICRVAKADAEKIDVGMWAWISADGKKSGYADVHQIGDTASDQQNGLSYTEVILQPWTYVDIPEGAPVDAEVYLAGSDDVLSVPLEAVTDRGTVWWVCENRCTEIPAEIVMDDEMRAWVNLPEGMQLAVGEFEEGQRVVEAAE